MAAHRRLTVAVIGACPFPTRQGSQVLLRQMAAALQRRGHAVHVVAYHNGEKGGPLPFPVHRIPRIPTYRKLGSGPALQKPLLDLLLARTLLRVVRRWGIEVLHAHNHEAAWASAWVARRTGLPLVLHCHTLWEEELPTYWSGHLVRSLARRAGHLLDSATTRLPDHLFALSSETVTALLARGVPASAVTLLPPGCDLEEFPPEDPAAAPAEGDQPRIVYAGTLDRFQNLGLLLAAFERVREAFPASLLEVITPSDPRALLAEARRRGLEGCVLVTPHGPFPEVLARLRAARVCALPRVAPAGFPMKLIAYMGAGRAIVASRGAAKGIHHMRTGVIVDDGDVEGFARGLLLLLRDGALRERLGQAARERALKEWAWPEAAERIEEVYHRLLRERRHPLDGPAGGH